MKGQISVKSRDQEPAATPNTDLKILLVDDSDTMREIIRQAIADNRNTIRPHFFQTQNQGGAIDFIKNNSPGLIIIDWDMKQPDKFEFVKNLREISEHTPIIILISVLDEKNVLEAGDAGVDAYIEKPIRSKNLWKQIEEFVD